MCEYELAMSRLSKVIAASRVVSNNSHNDNVTVTSAMLQYRETDSDAQQ